MSDKQSNPVRQEMKVPVEDLIIAAYVDAVRNGRPTIGILPARLSACALTDTQRNVIREARRISKRTRRSLQVQIRDALNKLCATPAGHEELPGVLKYMELALRRSAKKSTVPNHRARASFVQGGSPGLGKRS